MLEYIDNIRRNHGLEHATVQLLISRLGPEMRLVGRASHDGFFLFGSALSTHLVEECAREGLMRMQRGEEHWAVTPLCGTNLLTAGALASLATMAVIGNGSKKGNTGNAIMASVMAVTIAQPLGRLLQKHITTSPDVGRTEIVSVEAKMNGRYHKVHTRRIAA